ncbi:hypothetical protein B4064_1199 [Caldibacillus thermoamylovorans]|nr:hypothetical protein B4065_2495 [Caldibacillus thermoamylovorans]KIO69585.1 hypothetical protein B4064_1199 [Caldibacillus thermoamylovorans]
MLFIFGDNVIFNKNTMKINKYLLKNNKYHAKIKFDHKYVRCFK